MASLGSLQAVDLSGPLRQQGLAYGVSETGYVLGGLQTGARIYWTKTPATESAVATFGAIATSGIPASGDVWSQQVNDAGDALSYADVFRATGGGPPWTAEQVVLPPGAPDRTYLFLRSINTSGVIVGRAQIPFTGTRAYRWPSAGTPPVPLPEPAALPGTTALTSAEGINDAGDAVGWIRRQTSRTKVTEYAVLWRADGTILVLQSPWPSTRAHRINASGTIAGLGFDDRGVAYLVRWRRAADGSYGAPEQGPAATARELSAGAVPELDRCGRIAHRAQVWADGLTTYPLPPLAGEAVSEAYDIADDGTIVGRSYTPSTRRTPFRGYPVAWVGLGPCPGA